MHYRIERPKDAAAGSILEAVLASIRADREMQADLARLSRACCEPQKFIILRGAPLPVRYGDSATSPN